MIFCYGLFYNGVGYMCLLILCCADGECNLAADGVLMKSSEGDAIASDKMT